MNTKALITVLATLGSTSSLAMARPATQGSASAHVSWYLGAPARTYHAPAPVVTVRDHRSPYAAPAPIVVRPVAERYGRDGEWDNGWSYQRTPHAEILADGLTYNPGEYRKDIVLEGRGRFNTLTVSEQGGCTFIKEVRIEFLDGGGQSIPVNQTLEGNQAMTFELDGHDRAINRIFVYRADGDHMNIGFPSGGEFSVAAL